MLQDLLTRKPDYEAAYIALAKIHFTAGRSKEGIAALERLLQRNPNHPVALELLRQWKGR
jgi:predicted Zn-dependent protease